MKVKYYVLLIISIIFIGILFYIFVPHLKVKSLKIQCVYMSYACGDCYPQFNVKKVIFPSYTINNILNKDINIKIITNEGKINLQEDVNIKIEKDKYIGSYDFEVEGNLYYNVFNDTYTLQAKKYRYFLREGSVSN